MKKLLIIFAFLLFLAVSPSFAYDNTTDNPIGANYGDVYFNSSSLSDGDGSIDNPYNKITMDRINNYATLHLADGEYDVNGFKTISSLSIVGESQDKTIVRHDGLLFTVLSELSLNNLTLSGVTIENQGTVNATKVIFSDSLGHSSDSYNNVFGGVFDNEGTRYVTPNLYLDNCIFKNNHAEYGGAIYLINSNAFIYNCLFEKNIAYNFGGAIACDGSSRITIKNSQFKFDSSTNDAGGALYLKNSSVNIESSNFTSCNSTFGGAICDLNSDLSINDVQFTSNKASYDGGAIFKMYGDLSLTDSKFNFNSANNGAAIFADNSSSFIVLSSKFSSNNANNYGGAIYSLLNNNSRLESNIYTRNKAKYYPNSFETDSVNMFIGNNNYSMFKYNSSWEGEIPTKYSLLDEGYVTPVKDQQTSGNCWAFTAIATLESCILKAGNITYDLSEENMKNIIELYSDYGWDMDTNNGGYDNMAIGYLASWLGPILEENDLFDDYSVLSPVLDSILHVQNIIFLGRDNLTDNNPIKEAILKYGAVGTGLYYSGSYLFGDSYYYSGTESENHAVTIVGWDDDYPYYNFRNPAPANGAWIVKNSWKDDWANKGYFYVSYYDTRFARFGNTMSSYTFILNDTIRYDKNYQYDIIGLTKFLSTANNEVWYENAFNSTGDEILSAFSTYFTANSNWTAYVYVNDEYVFQQNGTALKGYYTFDFDNPVFLNKGDSFKIIVKLESKFASVPLSEKIYSNKVFSKKGISFISYDGNEWYDLYTYENSPVACLKAFTAVPSLTLKIDDISERYTGELFNITSFIADGPLNGSVVYNIDGNLVTVNMSDGVSNLQIFFNETGNYICSAYFVGEGLFSNKVNFTVQIRDKIPDTIIELDNITSVVDRIILVNASVYDENHELVTNGNLTFTVGNDTYICPVENGSAVCEVSFDMCGNYTIVASFKGINYNPSTKRINVEINKLKLKSNVTLNSSLVYTGDEIRIISNVLSDNLTVNSGFAVFSINGTKEFIVNISDSKAVSDVIFNKSGNYVVDVSFSHDKYEIDNCSLVISVSDRFSRVSISDLKVYAGDKCNVSAIVFDENDKKINAGMLKFNISDSIHVLSMNDSYLEIVFNESGIYDVYVEFEAFGYQKSFNKSVIEVSKKNTFIKLDNITSVVDKNIVVNPIVYDENNGLVTNGNLTLTVGNDTYICPVENGSAVCEVSFDKCGNYTIVASFNGVNYNPSTKRINMEINKLKLKSNVTSNSSLVYTGDEISIISNVISDNLTVNDGFAVFLINNIEYGVNISDNKSVLNVILNKSGNYVVDVSFSHDKYEIDDCSLVISVSDRFSRVSISDLKVYAGDKCNVSAIVFDENDKKINAGMLKFNINDRIYALSMDNPYLEIVFNESGIYDVYVEFEASGYLKSFNKSVIEVSKKNTFIKLDNMTSVVDKVILINAMIHDENNELVRNGNLTLTVGNDTYICPVENGSAICKISFDKCGNYTIVASFNGTNYNPSTKRINAEINKLKLKSDVTSNTSLVYTGDEIRIISNVICDNLTVNDGIAVFSINNTEYRTNISDSKAVLDVIFNKSGNYVVDVSFSHDKYEIDDCSLVISVSDRFSRVSISDLKVYAGDKCNVSAIVFDENGEIIEVGFLKFNISDRIYVLSMDDPYLEIVFNESGIYDVYVEFEAFGYQKSSNKSVIEVSKKNTFIKLDNITSVVDKNIVVNPIVYDENNELVRNGNLTLTVGNSTYVCSVENGSAICKISFDKCGNYTIVASFNGVNYNPSTKRINAEINKLKLKSDVTSNTSLVYTGDEIRIISNVICDNLTVNDGIAVFSINNTEYIINISDNKAVLDVNFNQQGNYVVDVSFSHDKYEIDDCSLVISVSDRFSRVSISDLKVYAGDKCNVSAIVFDENDKMINEGILKFNINDKIYVLSMDDPHLEIVFNESGIYDVYVEFEASGYQKSFNKSVIEVSKKDLDVDFTISDIYYGDDLIINIPSNDLVDVEITIDGVKYNLKTNTEFKIDNSLNAGKYEAILIFNGSKIYNSLNEKTNFTVKKLPLSADIKVENKTLIIEFSQAINGTLAIKINNQNYTVDLTNGESKLDLSNFTIGSYSGVIDYSNPNYDDVFKKFSFEIPKVNTLILVSDLVKYYKSSPRFELILIDEKGNYLANKSVIISISGVNYTRSTDEKGTASIGVNLNSGTYAVEVYFEGDDQFNSSRNSSKIIIKSTIMSNDLIKCYRNASQFYATILDYDGNPVKNKAITFNINGVFYNRQTNENGIVKLNINLVSGDYIITTENLITGERASNNIKVLSLIVENKNLVKYYRNDSQYSVKILGDDGNPVGAGKTVRFNINGVFYERHTNESSIAKLNINLNPGNYIITAEYNGCRVSNNITVKPILTAKDLTKNYGSSDQFVATLVDGQGNPYAKQYVEFNINGVFYKRLTGDNGQAKLNIRLMPGKYIITSAFGTFSTSNTILIK